MRRKLNTVFGLLAALTLAGCSSEVFYLSLDMRQPTAAGFNLVGKDMAVVYVNDPSGKDSLFNYTMAESFAKSLEDDYFDGEETVDLYRIDGKKGADYSQKDTLVNLLLSSGDDVVFLFDTPKWGEIQQVGTSTSGLTEKDSSVVVRTSASYRVNLYVYDSMSKVDTVRALTGSSTAKPAIITNGKDTPAQLEQKFFRTLKQQAAATGRKSAEKFLSPWKTENLPIYYFEKPRWEAPSQACYEMKWQKAMDGWMAIATSKNIDERACAKFNLATACYVLGDYDLATKWLDQSDADSVQLFSKSLRAKIDARMASK